MFSEAQSYLIKTLLDKNNISIFSFANSKDLTSFLKKNIEKLLNENVIDSLYKDIKNSLFNESEKLYRSVINEMYYVFYLTNNFKIDDYKNLFLDSKIFGKDIINVYFKNFLNEDTLSKKENSLKGDKYFEKNIKSLRWDILFLNDLLKDKLINLVLKYSLMCHGENVSDLIYNAIKEKNNDEDIVFINNYFEYFLRVMYCDMCEVLSLSNDNEGKCAFIATKKILETFDTYKMHDILFDKNIFCLYLNIILDIKRRKDARSKLSRDLKKIIKKNNPLYLLDEF